MENVGLGIPFSSPKNPLKSDIPVLGGVEFDSFKEHWNMISLVTDLSEFIPHCWP